MGNIWQLNGEFGEQLATNWRLFGEHFATLSPNIHVIIAIVAICSPHSYQTVSNSLITYSHFAVTAIFINQWTVDDKFVDFCVAKILPTSPIDRRLLRSLLNPFECDRHFWTSENCSLAKLILIDNSMTINYKQMNI